MQTRWLLLHHQHHRRLTNRIYDTKGVLSRVYVSWCLRQQRYYPLPDLKCTKNIFIPTKCSYLYINSLKYSLDMTLSTFFLVVRCCCCCHYDTALVVLLLCNPWVGAIMYSRGWFGIKTFVARHVFRLIAMFTCLLQIFYCQYTFS